MGNKKKLVLIPDRLKADEIHLEKSVLGPDFEIVACNAKKINEIQDDLLSQVDAIVAWQDLRYSAETISKLTNCKIIVRAGAGFDNVDLGAAFKKGIVVSNVPDYGTEDVADHAISLMLTQCREIAHFSNKVRDEKAWEWSRASGLKRLRGSTLGVLGLGRIGSATAIRAKTFGMNVCYFDPYISDGIDKVLNVKKIDSLEEMLPMLDVLTIHTPLTSETNGLLSEKNLRLLKPGAILINTARGEIVSTDGLYEVLKSGHLRSAGVDVLSSEPPDENHPLIKAWRSKESWLADRLIITPHMAFFNKESYEELRTKAVKTVKDFFINNKQRNVVNRNYQGIPSQDLNK